MICGSIKISIRDGFGLNDISFALSAAEVLYP